MAAIPHEKRFGKTPASIWLPMWRAATTVVREATASLPPATPAGALVNAALTAAALLLGGPAPPAGAQSSTDASLSGLTTDGNDAIVTSTRQYRYDVSGYTTRVTVVVTTAHGGASVDIDPTPRLPRRFGPRATTASCPSTRLAAWSG